MKKDQQILEEQVETVDTGKKDQAVLQGEGTGRPPEVVIGTTSPWTNLGTATVTEAGHTLVKERDPLAMIGTVPSAVTETDPTATTETDPTAMTETDTTAVTETDPTSVTERDPTAVTETGPTAMTEIGFTIVKETGHTTMTEVGMRMKLAVSATETGVPGQVAEVLVEGQMISIIPRTETAAWKGCHPYLERKGHMTSEETKKSHP